MPKEPRDGRREEIGIVGGGRRLETMNPKKREESFRERKGHRP